MASSRIPYFVSDRVPMHLPDPAGADRRGDVVDAAAGAEIKAKRLRV
jgi:hypothetical protein